MSINFAPYLRCVGCAELPSLPYECIKCGYLTCSNCLSGYCAKCKNNSKYRKCMLASLLVGYEKITCEFCFKEHLFGEIHSHKLECTEWKFKCNQPSCQFQGKNKEFMEHIAQSHERTLINKFDVKHNQAHVESDRKKTHRNTVQVDPSNMLRLNGNLNIRSSVSNLDEQPGCIIY